MNLIFTTFVLLFEDKMLDPMANFTFKQTFLQCAQYCVHEHRCRVVFYHAEMKQCLPHAAVLSRKDVRLVKRSGYKCYRSDLIYPPNTCLDIQWDNPGATDGEYKIFPSAQQFHGKAVKIFCLMSVNPPEEYVSLNDKNYGDLPNIQQSNFIGCSFHSRFASGADAVKRTGIVQYRKIRVLPDTMTIVKDDKRFCETKRENACMYGRSEDCYSQSCGAKGIFCGNTAGTGMKFSHALQWRKHGYKPHDPKVNWYDEGMEVIVTCGGKCGGCDVVGEMLLYPHP